MRSLVVDTAHPRVEPSEDEAPLRAELFSADQMEDHGFALARFHRVQAGAGRNDLLLRLDQNESVLVATRALLAGAIIEQRRVTPASEWLLDNYYLIDENLRTARRHFPKSYSWQLPRLVNGASSGLPRIYDIALNAIFHGDGRFDQENLQRFVAAYQRTAVLSLGELWAIPIMLRLALIENLRQVATRLALDRRHRDLAARWADAIANVVLTDPKNLILVVADMARSEPPVSGSFVAELTQRLKELSVPMDMPLSWLEQRLAHAGVSIEQLVQSENQQQAADQISISNSVGSLRLLHTIDWRGFVEHLSRTEAVLATDPAGIYPQMDFATRDAYRHVIERLARRAENAEDVVAHLAVELAGDARASGQPVAHAHVGYFLVDKGLASLEERLGLRKTRHPMSLAIYISLIVLLTLVFTSGPTWLLWRTQHSPMLIATTIVFMLVATSQLALQATHWLAVMLSQPRALPRMDYSSGIPDAARTAVVVPTMLGSRRAARQEVEDIEIRYLANRDANLRFVLLGDFPDASGEQLPGDEAILAEAAAGIERLNRRYAASGSSVFFLLHRPRRWNAGEAAWIGEERKRGKISDLNALLRGGDEQNFLRIVGDLADLRGARYVITLDSDTELPRGAAHLLVATMQHPLNQPVFDEQLGRVISGYGILQPRVGTSLTLTGASAYAKLFGGDAGLDPYTRAVSDIYQDLFGEGSFTGKGIYDVDVFERALTRRFPPNRILSHDLLEGCYVRAGLASDISLFEHFPARYSSDVARHHRWMRGDWQIARWLFPRVPREDATAERNPLSVLSRWKIFDNLRRSLVAPSLFVLFVLGWTVLSPSAYWMAFLLQLILVPVIFEALLAAARKPVETTLRQHLEHSLRSAGRVLGQAFYKLACLPFEALLAVDAIVRTLWRQMISHRHLLEWTPSSVVERRAPHGFPSQLKRMAFAPLAALATALMIFHLQPNALLMALPLLGLWLVSPWLAWRVSRPPRPTQETLDAHHVPLLRAVSRRTWHFFERFVGPEDHYLPPDNFQEHPGAVLAHRTSPTNIGLGLLANLAAYDFGYLSLRGLLERSEATFATLDRLQRHHGHFYNWYDTRTLQPLPPRYVSTVDSGNLAGHLLTLRQGFLALDEHAENGMRMLPGLLDTARMLQGSLPEGSASRFLAEIIERAQQAIHDPGEGSSRLSTLEHLLALTRRATHDIGAEHVASEALQRLVTQCADLLEETIAFEDETSAAGTTTPSANRSAVAGWRSRLRTLAQRAARFSDIEYDFLYDDKRDLFHIGFNVDEHRRDNGYYDLLASEVRLGIFVSIAQGRIAQQAWFALARLMIRAGNKPLLLSWSGSMFEYLMPNLVMPAYPQSLLDSTNRAAVARQISYGAERGVPWGISECGYLLTDAAQNYQYRAFGVPGLGLQRGLSQELVIAPYASALALLVDPNAAARNLQRMEEEGWLGMFGFYEAIDFTTSRLLPGQRFGVVRSYMAHHQAMSLLATAHVLLDRPMQRRFERDPQVQSALLLLQERVPRASGQPASDPKLVDVRSASETPAVPLRVFNRPDPAYPAVQLLSNGRYHVMVTSAGGGYSRWQNLALTRWEEDPVRDHWGTFCYLRDMDSGAVWSTAFQPTLADDENYEAIFTEARIEFRRRRDGWETHTEIVVSPEDDIELRRTRITNRASTPRMIEVTSYAEIVLAPAISDSLHPAFSKLFVQTEIVPSRNAILGTRRPRDARESLPTMFHLLTVHKEQSIEVSFETDRAQFLGRGRSAHDPQAIADGGPLRGGAGSVLDPIVAIRHLIRVEPEQTVHVDLVLGIGRDREHCLQLIDKYHDRRLADRVFDLAWTHSRVSLRQINISETEAQIYARLAGSMLYAQASMRSTSEMLLRNRRGQPALWAYAISGDLPIMLVRIDELANLDLARDAVRAHTYWRMKGMATDLVIWNEERSGYRQELHDALMDVITATVDAGSLDRPGGIFLRSVEQIPHEDRILFLAIARVVLDDKSGSLVDQIHGRRIVRDPLPKLSPLSRAVTVPGSMPREALAFDNGKGGFSADGREYVITSSASNVTPLPWINVLANPGYGCIVTESGGGYTWRENAHEFRLTPWYNDPVSDVAGEAFYLRDEETGHYWSPSPLPARGTGSWTTRHGFGYSTFEHIEDGIHSEQRVYLALDASVKFIVLRLRNLSGRVRRLSATGYVQWVLGDLPAKTAMHVTTELDARSGALFARNPYHTEFGDWVSFFDVDEPERTLTGDRLEFIGRNGSLAEPAAMACTRLSGRVGAGVDPCGAIQIPFELQDGQSRRIIFRLGAARSEDEASALVQQMRRTGTAHDAYNATRDRWNTLLGAIQIDTPDKSLDALVNGWLLYQVIGCRLWGRSGYYQSGGAIGFRDQLQDCMALVHAAPSMLRSQLLLCASRQFREGDVQHWWHPPAGRGVRTRCSDDYLWLPLATSRYVACSGDSAVLDETESFLDGRALNSDEESYYDLPLRGHERASLYEHCVRAILRGLHFGVHGLPLMGSGDWNDGMNEVGAQGRGESVWLGFFLHRVLIDFVPLARVRGDEVFALRCEEEARKLRENLEQHAWDGAWYRRAYFDDGTPLGSSSGTECRIDSIAQSWSVLSGAAPGERAQLAIDALLAHLVRPEANLVQLLDPPFDGAGHDPGYIRGYVPGVRENGGQYTHAAIWAAMACAESGRTEDAWRLLDMINPLRHGMTPEAVDIYKAEPYVVAADVYAVEPHTGRGGWTWYTGSAGWLYRLIIESLLGIRREGGNGLRVDPRLPASWPSFNFHYRFGATSYHIEVTATQGVVTPTGGVLLDLVDDGNPHTIALTIGRE